MTTPVQMSLQTSVTHPQPACFIAGRWFVYRITCLHSTTNVTLILETEVQLRAKKQATLIQHFWTRWRLPGLREFHQANAPNVQTFKPGAIVLVHDDTLHINWRLAVVEDTIVKEDGLIKTANIRTSTGRINHPVTKSYPLEVTMTDPLLLISGYKYIRW